jgi:hypothetical protein
LTLVALWALPDRRRRAREAEETVERANDEVPPPEADNPVAPTTTPAEPDSDV